METTTTVTIGKVQYDIPEMNFAALEMAWPFVEASMISENPTVDGPGAGLAIIACTLIEADDWDIMHDRWTKLREKHNVDSGNIYKEQFDALLLFFKRELKVKEISQIREAIDTMLKEAGLIAEPGELSPEGPEEAEILNPSTETSDLSSQSSSQPELKEPAGKA